jgi:hypothetical protein
LPKRLVVNSILRRNDVLLIPGVRLFDVESGKEKSSFAGPVAGSSTCRMRVRGKEQTVSHHVGRLAFDRWLFSWLPQGSFSIWDINDGARLFSDPDFAPLSYHPGTRKFISQSSDGALRLTRINQGP